MILEAIRLADLKSRAAEGSPENGDLSFGHDLASHFLQHHGSKIVIFLQFAIRHSPFAISHQPSAISH
jgi:hypothetical protein